MLLSNNPNKLFPATVTRTTVPCVSKGARRARRERLPLFQPLGQRHPGLLLQEGAEPAGPRPGCYRGAPARAGSTLRQEPQVKV